MRRPTARRQQPGVALFPFLAVLICTMGSLIVLLVLVVQGANASAEAERVAEAQAAKPIVDPQLQQLAEDITWRAEIMQQQREELERKLNNKKLELAHLEDHIRRLQDQAKQLKEKSDAVEQAGQNNSLDQEFAQLQLEELKQQLETKKRELEETKRKQADRKPAYAILPYDGPHGTNRRPVYIECREEGVVLQPEGIVFSPQDFEGPLGPGNPLDAALRAVREHHQKRGLPGEPYPLIVVRPNGALAFGACRAAMKHWENEFGYELIDQEMELKFPPGDPLLADTLQRTIKDARVRQAVLVEAMPNRFNGEARLASFRASEVPQENSLLNDGTPNGRGGAGGVGSRGTAGRGVGGAGIGGAARGGMENSLTSATGGSGANMSSGGGISGGGFTGGSGSLGMPSGTRMGMSGAGQTTASGLASGTGGTGQGKASGSSVANANSANGYGAPSGAAGVANGSGSPSRGVSGGVAGGNSTAGATAGMNSMSGGGTQSGMGSGMSSAMGQTASDQPPSGMSGSSSSASGSASSSAAPSLQLSAARDKAKKALKQRGKNWGLPDASQRATAITRPIYMECYADRLVLLPDRGEGRAPLVVPVESGVAENLDYVLGTVWQHMDRWGMAMLNGYWKPVLSIDVKRGGEAHFAELQAALQGSGIDVEKKP